MIKHLLIGAALLAATPAYGDDTMCPNVGKLAESIMTARQQEAPYSEVRKVLEKYRYSAPAIYRLAQRITADAYDQEPMQSAVYRQRQAAEFRNKWERLCYQVADEQPQQDDDFIGS